MTPPFVHRARRSLEASVQRIDREDITHWLMMFSARLPLRREHPRMGKIAIEGVTFSGSVVHVYDQYILLTVDDLVADTTQAVEEALPGLPRQDRGPAVKDMTDAIAAAKARLLARAGEIKGILLAPEGSRGPPARIGEQINWTPYAERLAHTLRTLRISTMTDHKVSRSWFRRYRTTLDRMRSAEPSAFASRAARLSAVLSEPEFSDVRALLTDPIDLSVWLAKARSEEVEFGEPFPFPKDPLREMGVAISLLDHLATSNEIAEQLAFNHYDDPHDAKIVTSWRNMVDAIYAPLENELHDYLEAQGWLEAEAAPASNAIHVQDATGVVIQQGVHHATQTAMVTIMPTEVAPALAAFAAAMRPSFTGADLRDFEADVRTMEAQLEKPKPSATILRECGVSLRSLTEGVVAGALTPPAISAAIALWAALGLG